MSTSSDRPGRDPYPANTPGTPVDRNRDGIDDRSQTVDRDADGVDDRREAVTVDRDADGVDDRREAVAHDRNLVDRRDVAAREREAFGGVKVGAAFFGWLTAFGTAVILTAILAATGAALGHGLAGGYVAGRMARFNGIRQGIAVWVWALVIAIIVALAGVVLGSQYDIFGELNVFPRIPIAEGDLTVAGIITTIVVILASLGGAILGGKAGTHYHRKVDRAGYAVER
jgi:hypothetical protein